MDLNESCQKLVNDLSEQNKTLTAKVTSLTQEIGERRKLEVRLVAIGNQLTQENKELRQAERKLKDTIETFTKPTRALDAMQKLQKCYGDKTGLGFTSVHDVEKQLPTSSNLPNNGKGKEITFVKSQEVREKTSFTHTSKPGLGYRNQKVESKKVHKTVPKDMAETSQAGWLRNANRKQFPKGSKTKSKDLRTKYGTFPPDKRDWIDNPNPKAFPYNRPSRPFQKGNAKGKKQLQTNAQSKATVKGKKQLQTNAKPKAAVSRKVPNSAHDTRRVPFVKLSTWPLVWVGGKKMQWVQKEKPPNQTGPT
jgi:hypothetical protein